MWQLDPWNPDYRLPSRAALDESAEVACPAVLGLEGSWEARRPQPVAPEDWPLLYFVDGRLRFSTKGRISTSAAQRWERVRLGA